jgi:hypothetical protein
MAAGESADITTATESKGEGRFIGELRSVSVRTQRPNQHDSARAEKFHPNFSKPRALVGALKQVSRPNGTNGSLPRSRSEEMRNENH